MNINNENYYTQKANLKYMSCSQFKDFRKCEEMALAKISGDHIQPTTNAMLIGSYVDAHYESTLDVFKTKHPEIFKRDSSLKADYVMAEKLIKRTESDPLFSKYMSGEKQIIMTGEIENIPFKIKMDSYHKDKAIVDLKCMKDFKPIWNEDLHQKEPFVEAWGYDIQGAIYQEIVYQNTGRKLPFFITAVTKENVPDMAVISIPQERLDDCLNLVKALAPRYQALKLGHETAARCGKCDWCKETKMLTEIIDYRDIGVVDNAD